MADNIDFEERILRSLRRITRAIDLHSRRLAAQYHLTSPQLVCLRQIAREAPISPSVLAKSVSLSQATVTGIVDRLETKGLAERRRDQKDRRKLSLHLTEKGRRILEEAPVPLQEHFARRLGALTPDDQARIDEVLLEVVEMMEAHDLPAAPMITTGNVEATSAEVEQFLDQDTAISAPGRKEDR